MRSLSVVLALACVLTATAQDRQPPAVLDFAFAQRSAERLRTARIEWSLREGDPRAEDPPRTIFYSWQAAGDSYANVDRGDQDGVVLRKEDGSPAEYTHRGPIAYLASGPEVWMHHQDAGYLGVWDASRAETFRVMDLRRLGLQPIAAWETIDEDLRRAGQPPLEYTTRQDGELICVTARSGQNGATWWIDSQRDHNVVRMEVIVDGRKLGETRCILGKFDGVWFPRRVETYRFGAGDRLDGEPSRVYELHSAEFNRPEHPQRIDPTHIGAEPGMQVLFHDGPERDELQVWDGRQAVGINEFNQRVEAGELTIGPTVARARERGRARREREARLASAPSEPPGAVPPPERASWKLTESRWEAYTRQVIACYRLDEEQSQRAWAILRDCQDRAGGYLARNAEKIEAVERELADAATEERPRVEDRLRALLRPLDEVFENRLKPRLEKLPTRAQREAAGAALRPRVWPEQRAQSQHARISERFTNQASAH